MFVLSNAWRALTRSKQDDGLSRVHHLAVTFGTVADWPSFKKIPTHTPPRYDQQNGHVGHSPDCGYVEEGLRYGLGFHQALHDVDLIHRIRHARPVGHQLVELHGYRNRAGPRER